jgi:uncharacterized protein YlzI (FlbEa/FlbD family)
MTLVKFTSPDGKGKAVLVNPAMVERIALPGIGETGGAALGGQSGGDHRVFEDVNEAVRRLRQHVALARFTATFRGLPVYVNPGMVEKVMLPFAGETGKATIYLQSGNQQRVMESVDEVERALADAQPPPTG